MSGGAAVNQFKKFVRTVQAFTRELGRATQPIESPAVLQPRPKLGIALGGGFARGLAHIGVLKVLEEEKIPIDYIAGTSVGSVIGAAYCSGISAKELEEIAGLVRFRDFARWTLSRYGFCSNDRMHHFLGRVVRCKNFEELKIPLAIAATDFVTGAPVVFRSGCILDPVRASCAYPGMFLPVTIDGRMLVDGMLGHAVPTTPLREMGADRVIAVYLSAHWVQMRGPRHLFDVIGQCFSIAQERMSTHWKKDADVVIEPNVDGVAYDGFDRAPELIRAGEESIRAILPQIRNWLGITPPVEIAQLAPPLKPVVDPHASAA